MESTARHYPGLTPTEKAVVEYLRVSSSGGAAAQEHLLGTGVVARLEARLRFHYAKRHALAVSNATSGLFALALALDLKNAEVVTPALGWGGTLAGLLHGGARLNFADVEAATLALCPDAARTAITTRTRALVAVDLFGVPADDRALRDLADEHGLWYVHDAAQSLGATRGGSPAGALADALVVSFTAGKTLFAGEGGAILTDHDDLYERLIWLTQHPYRHKRQLGLNLVNEFALNMRIHPLAAVWADADFEASLERLARRQMTAQRILRIIEASGLVAPVLSDAASLRPSYARLTAAWWQRPHPAALDHALGAHGIPGAVYALPLQPLYRHAAYRSQHPRFHRPHAPQAEDQATRRLEVWGWETQNDAALPTS